ncbi:hypothetical protein Z517_09191 [Fonsecaea pedrosoi CBS 271.37]|uniref:Unplaced genomic scaffold supercont1.6, whole genome shotgun sequence n=1 Tax=Fonsecaea pedrosoi CBS 271.37 TaxID=1442368 RepID=A0A0D2ER57_9EURO|nr:uncharacterized protein Z517_09191 [Fonsecaea pedrosoi CBS 271.37]KIW76747.1 hypothetical protein Z517_09191 [Fonsecaea pedrosoi CBS 271.37]
MSSEAAFTHMDSLVIVSKNKLLRVNSKTYCTTDSFDGMGMDLWRNIDPDSGETVFADDLKPMLKCGDGGVLLPSNAVASTLLKLPVHTNPLDDHLQVQERHRHHEPH